MKKVENVKLTSDKVLTCPFCNSTEFYSFAANLRNTTHFDVSLFMIGDGKGYICTRCGYRLDFFRNASKEKLKKGNKQTPTSLK